MLDSLFFFSLTSDIILIGKCICDAEIYFLFSKDKK